MPTLKNVIEKSPALSLVSALVTGILFGVGAGYGSYRAFLEATNQQPVIRGSYILKSELANGLLRTEAVREIEHLIETGNELGSDTGKITVWLLQVLAFIHGIDLEQDSAWQGQRMSAVEADIRWALQDPSVTTQAQKTLGILKGFRQALLTRVAR